jgi:peptidoglycan/xylan/chitin deacetylase (PgdA/CDA1 family)
MFHGVTEDPGNSVRNISTKEFKKILSLLNKHFEIVSLEKIVKESHSNKPQIAITFDDGYLNNFNEAIPILENISIPATFFIITKSLTTDRTILPIDFIDCIIDNENPPEIIIDNKSFYRKNNYRLSENNELIYDYIIRNSDRMAQIDQQLQKQFDIEFYRSDSIYSKRAVLVNEETLKKHISKSIFSFQSHTHSHINLNIDLNESQLSEELGRPIESINKLTSRRCDMIAFPYGEYNSNTIKTGKALGYNFFFAVTFKNNGEAMHSNLFQRIGISNTTNAEVNFINMIIQSGKKSF